MQTSLIHNKKYKFYKMLGFGSGAMFGLLTSLIADASGGLQFAWIAATTGVFAKITKFYCDDSRGYPFKGRDQLLERFSSSNFNNDKTKGLNMGFLPLFCKFRDDLLYHNDGKVSLGFKFSPHKSEKDLNQFLQETVKKVLREASHKTLVQFIKISTPIRHSGISEERNALIKNGLKEKNYFIFITTTQNDRLIETYPQLLEDYATRLSQEDMQTYHGFLALPEDGLDAQKAKTPLWEVNHVLTKNRSVPHQNSKCYGSVSMASLPEQTSDTFHDIFRQAESVDGIICTSFMKTLNLYKEIIDYKRREEIKKTSDKKLSDVDLEVVKQEEYLESRGLKVALSMTQTLLLYGENEKITEAIRSMTTGQHQELVNQRAVYLENNNYMKNAIKACQIGQFNTFPMGSRSLFIGNIEEATTYLPKLTFPTPEIPYLGLILRDTDNSPAFIDHRGGDETPAMMVLGASGSGKSAFLSSIIRAHECLGRDTGVETAIFIMDVGSSYTWIDPECDLIFRLSKNGLNMPIYPLEIFRPSHTASEEEKFFCIDHAQQFVRRIINSEGEPEVTDIITGVIKDIIQKGTSLRFVNVTNELKKAIRTKNIEFSERWKNIVITMTQLSQGGAYGHIFDPEYLQTAKVEIAPETISKIQFDLADKDTPNDIAQVFLELGYAASKFYSSVFDSKSAYSKSLLAVFDEFDAQRMKLKDRAYENASLLVNHARKSGIIPVFASQDSSHFVNDTTQSEEKQNEIFQGIGNLFFYNFDINETIAKKIFKGGDFQNGIKRVQQINQEIIKDTTGKTRIYSIGHIDKARRVNKKHPDLEDDFLWRITTASGGLQIKYEFQRRLENWEPAKIHRKLSDHRIPIYKDAVNEKLIDHIFYKIMDVERG